MQECYLSRWKRYKYQSEKFFFVVVVKICFYLKSRFTKKRKDGEVFHLLVHCPNSHKGLSWADAMLGARNFWIFHTSGGLHNLRPPSLLSYGTSREQNCKWNSWDMTSTHMGRWHHRVEDWPVAPWCQLQNDKALLWCFSRCRKKKPSISIGPWFSPWFGRGF